MAFCIECGFRLPTDAVFCPNCGSRIKAAAPAVTEEQAPEAEVVETSLPADEISPADIPEPANEAPPPPPPGGSTYYGYPTSGGGAPDSARSGGSKTAIIVIASVVVLLIVAAVFIVNFFGGNKLMGYWESEEIDSGYGFEDEIFGYDVEGMFGLQLNADNTFSMISAFDTKVLTGTWKESGNGLTLGSDDGGLYIRYARGKLLMEANNYVYRFEKSKRSIDNPTLKPGAYVGGGAVDAPTAIPGNKIVAGSGEAENGAYYVSVVGAEEFGDIDNKPAIRIYYEFTNNSEYTVSAYSALDFSVTQNGNELEPTFVWEDVAVYSNDSYRVRPGVTIQCCVQYGYSPSGSEVHMEITGWETGEDGGVIKATYAPDNLPGAPAALEIAEIPNPEWTLALPESGDLNDGACHVAVTEAEIIGDSFGQQAVRIFFEFTNKGDAPANMYDSVYILAYQDGIGLPESYDEVADQTDENLYQNVPPGKTVTASLVFTLRNETSNVEVEVESLETYDAVGQTYKLK